MQITSEQRADLSAQIDAELDLARTMLDLLQHEHAVLTNGAPDAIKSISKQKLEHMQLMEQNIGRRNQFLRSCRLTTDEQGIEQAVAMMGDRELSANWEELKTIAKQLKTQNDLNGGIIALGQRRVKQALDILSGKENLTGTYSQSGETQFSKSNNLHTKA